MWLILLSGGDVGKQWGSSWSQLRAPSGFCTTPLCTCTHSHTGLPSHHRLEISLDYFVTLPGRIEPIGWSQLSVDYFGSDHYLAEKNFLTWSSALEEIAGKEKEAGTQQQLWNPGVRWLPAASNLCACLWGSTSTSHLICSPPKPLNLSHPRG